MSFDHISIYVPADRFEPLIDWCKAAFGHLGLVEITRPVEWVVGLGAQTGPWLWFAQMSMDGLDAKTVDLMLKNHHIALGGSKFVDPRRLMLISIAVEQVKEFHKAAVAAGGSDNGGPGPRPEYTPSYYGAFVRDPVCNINFEVCCKTFKEGDDK